MKTALTVAALALLTGCQGFMGLDYHTEKYMVGTNHEVVAQAIAGAEQADGKYEIVIGKNAKGEMVSWTERDGKYVNSCLEPRRAFRNPWWPFPHRKALKKGTPSELGLVIEPTVATKSHKWFLHVEARHRIVARYEAACAMFGKENVTVAIGEHFGKRYWVEMVVDGKRYTDTCTGVYRYHYQSRNPYGKGYVEQWRGGLQEWQALADAYESDPVQVAKARANAKADLDAIPPSYWLYLGREKFALSRQ